MRLTPLESLLLAAIIHHSPGNVIVVFLTFAHYFPRVKRKGGREDEKIPNYDEETEQASKGIR